MVCLKNFSVLVLIRLVRSSKNLNVSGKEKFCIFLLFLWIYFPAKSKFWKNNE